MATLLGPWQRALDDNVAPIPGAKLFTFDSVATTTPKTTYSDPELTVPHTNPVVADAFGNFPQIFAETGDSFYLLLKTSADVLVEEYEAVDALGEQGTGTFSRDFGLNGRFDVRGSGGEVYIEVGSPAGDDVGGSAVISGWGGTNLDTLDIRSSATSFTGAVTFDDDVTFSPGGAPSGLPVVISEGTVSAAPELIVELPAGYTDLQLKIEYLTGSESPTGTALRGRFSFDGGSTYLSSAASYRSANFQVDNAGGGSGNSATATEMTLGNSTGMWDPDGETFAFLELNVTTKASKRSGVRGNAWSSQGKALVYQSTTADQPRATHIKIYFASGTISGDWRLIGTKD